MILRCTKPYREVDVGDLLEVVALTDIGNFKGILRSAMVKPWAEPIEVSVVSPWLSYFELVPPEEISTLRKEDSSLEERPLIKVKGWWNLYGTIMTGPFPRKESADACALGDRTGCKWVDFSYKEGEGIPPLEGNSPL